MLRSVLKWFATYWRPQRRWMLLLFALTTVGIALRSLYPYVFKYVIDSLTDNLDFSRVRTWILIILGLGIAREITQWLLPSTRLSRVLVIGKGVEDAVGEVGLFHDPSDVGGVGGPEGFERLACAGEPANSLD